MQVVVGRIGRAHGVKGDVVVDLAHRRARAAVLAGSVIDNGSGCRRSDGRRQARGSSSGRFLVHFAEIDDRTGAEQLRGITLLADVDPSERPEDPDEFYDRQIVGLLVVEANRGPIGRVAEVLHRPGQDLLSVTSETGPPVLIPFVAALVGKVDLDAGQLVVDLPDGLIELGEV